ncbi:alpha-amylase family glycosyl hydrolase [Oerskovia turbata]
MLDLASRLDRAVLYQIYPQSFADSNGDGVGDLRGIVDRLDYLRWLGVDALWLTPVFVSPFADAGYDVADFLQVAPRYGSNEDMALLTREAASRGISVVLDLVAGHTSDEHPWFAASADDPDDDRYIWSAEPGPGLVAGPGKRGQHYLPNFFDCQPALNYGYARPHPDEPWRQPVDAPGPRANREALREVMRHWFDLGVGGFRVDMAGSLVKDDGDQVETGRLWAEMRAWVDETYPGRILISEWGDPRLAVPAGFHADFLLQFGGGNEGLALRSLWENGAGTRHELWGDEPCWADAEARGDARPFVDAWRAADAAISAAGRGGVVGLPTANHDFTRLVAGERDREQARPALVMALTWPAMPSVYYGDEIGMRYVPDTPSIEGSRLGPTYDRAGSRTPMQWGETDPSLGGTGSGPSRYLPEDPDPARPTVADQHADPESLLRLVRDLIALRHADRRLDTTSPVEVLATTYPFAYVRGGSLLVAANPGREAVELDVPGLRASARRVLARGCTTTDGRLRLDGFGYAVLDLG